MNQRAIAFAVAAAGAALLSACTGVSPDGGFGAVQRSTQQHLSKEVVWARSTEDLEGIERRVTQLLAKPLVVDDAVQVALLNNRGLQARLQDLGITEAEVVQAGRLPNPGFTWGRTARGEEREIDRGLHVNLARLILMPLTNHVQARRLQQTQGEVAAAVLALAAETRKAYYHALAAEEGQRYAAQVMQAAQASAELARRMEQVGNFNKLQRAREQSFYAEASLKLAHAQQLQMSTRERLTRLLGLWGPATAFAMPARLPDLPAAPLDLPDVEQVALAQRLDVQGAKLAAEQTASNLGLTRTRRFINVLELGLVRNGSNDLPTQRGWEVSLELPLFDWGGARVARAQAVYMQSVHLAAEAAINARSEVREAYQGYRLAYDIARHHREEMVPLQQRIAQENLLRYNGMLIGVFELLADARSQIAGVNASIQALRDFWIAQADLDMALIGKPSLTVPNMVGPASGGSEPRGGVGH